MGWQLVLQSETVKRKLWREGVWLVKARYKVLMVVVLLWMGMSYEGAREAAPLVPRREDMTLEEQIRLYELGLIDRLEGRLSGSASVSGRDAAIPHTAYQGNWFARTGRRIGNALQRLIREVLRGLVRFFDGIIT